MQASIVCCKSQADIFNKVFQCGECTLWIICRCCMSASVYSGWTGWLIGLDDSSLLSLPLHSLLSDRLSCLLMNKVDYCRWMVALLDGKSECDGSLCNSCMARQAVAVLGQFNISVLETVAKFVLRNVNAIKAETTALTPHHRSLIHTIWYGRPQVDGYRSLRRKSAFGLAMTLTFDLWSWKPFQQCSLTWWIIILCQVSLKCLPLRLSITEISRHTE